MYHNVILCKGFKRIQIEFMNKLFRLQEGNLHLQTSKCHKVINPRYLITYESNKILQKVSEC